MIRLDDSANFRYLKKFEGGRLFAQIVELIEDRFRHNVLLEFFEFASVYVQIKSQMIRYGAGQGDNLRYLVFGEQAQFRPAKPPPTTTTLCRCAGVLGGWTGGLICPPFV
jgi:hypothetical protein